MSVIALKNSKTALEDALARLSLASKAVRTRQHPDTPVSSVHALAEDMKEIGIVFNEVLSEFCAEITDNGGPDIEDYFHDQIEDWPTLFTDHIEPTIGDWENAR